MAGCGRGGTTVVELDAAAGFLSAFGFLASRLLFFCPLAKVSLLLSVPATPQSGIQRHERINENFIWHAALTPTTSPARISSIGGRLLIRRRRSCAGPDPRPGMGFTIALAVPSPQRRTREKYLVSFNGCKVSRARRNRRGNLQITSWRATRPLRTWPSCVAGPRRCLSARRPGKPASAPGWRRGSVPRTDGRPAAPPVRRRCHGACRHRPGR